MSILLCKQSWWTQSVVLWMFTINMFSGSVPRGIEGELIDTLGYQRQCGGRNIDDRQ